MSSCGVILQHGEDWFVRFALADRSASSIEYSWSPWNDWRAVETQCRLLALDLLEQPSEKS